MQKKGVSLPLETVVIAIIVLVVLVLVIFFIARYGGQLGSSIGDQAKQSTNLLPNLSAP